LNVIESFLLIFSRLSIAPVNLSLNDVINLDTNSNYFFNKTSHEKEILFFLKFLQLKENQNVIVSAFKIIELNLSKFLNNFFFIDDFTLKEKILLMVVMLYKSFHKLNCLNYKEKMISTNSDLILDEYYEYYKKFIVYYDKYDVIDILNKNKIKKELYRICATLVMNGDINEIKIYSKNKTVMN
jgi:hypothetical protein